MDTTERYFSDSEVRKFYYKLDYKKFRFDPDKFTGTGDAGRYAAYLFAEFAQLLSSRNEI